VRIDLRIQEGVTAMGLEAFLFYGYPYDPVRLKDFATERRMNAVREKWRRRREQKAAVKPLEERVASLEKDLGYVTLVLGAVLDRLNEKGVVTRDEVHATVQSLDDVDGVRDGSLDVNVLRELKS
jgi:hypothetical protein